MQACTSFRLPLESVSLAARFCDPGSSSSRARNSWKNLFSYIGHGFFISIAYIDPGNFETDLQAGARYIYELVAIFFHNWCKMETMELEKGSFAIHELQAKVHFIYLRFSCALCLDTMAARRQGTTADGMQRRSVPGLGELCKRGRRLEAFWPFFIHRTCNLPKPVLNGDDVFYGIEEMSIYFNVMSVFNLYPSNM